MDGIDGRSLPPGVASSNTVLFDLDGTLSDSAPGILAALRHGFAVNGLPPMDAHTERSVLGPPFFESLPPIVGADLVWPVIEAYRERYATAMFESTLFPGIIDLLDALRADGRRLVVATSKPEHFAVPIVEHLGIADYFDTVAGDELDGSLRTKALVIGTVLGRLGNPDVADLVMIGDRRHDIIGARAHGMAGVGVRWGYASPNEFDDPAPIAVCATPTELAVVLGVS